MTVDPSLVDFKSLSDEVRFRIFDCLWGRGVRSSELEVDPRLKFLKLPVLSEFKLRSLGDIDIFKLKLRTCNWDMGA